MLKYGVCFFVLLSLTACSSSPSDSQASLDTWANAAIAGDYVTAREVSRDSDFIFAVWQDQTERARRETNPQSYTILASEQRGQTTVYWIRLNGTEPRCTIVELDPAGRVSAPRAWAPNGICGAPGVTP